MISAVINTYNEEKHIQGCLESIKWVDEIVIVDMYSADRTIEIASKYTKLIYYYPRCGYVEPARNFAINKAHGEWILLIDADERLSPGLSENLRDIAKNCQYDVCRIYRDNYFWGQVLHHSGWQSDAPVRFFKKGFCSFEYGEVHVQPSVRGNIHTLQRELGFLLHYPYESVSTFVRKMDNYTESEARKLLDKEKTAPGRMQMSARFLQEFCRRYFRRRGYRDGIRGFMASALMATYWFVAYVKLWEHFNAADKSNQ